MRRLILINFVVFFCCIVLIECGAGVWLHFISRKKPTIAEKVSESARGSQVTVSPSSLKLGFLPEANQTLRVTKTVDSKTIYDVNYVFDEEYRRMVPQNLDRAKPNFMVFLGGSNLFGQGVAGEKTLPALMASASPEYRIYNYAMPGWGPNNILALTESGRLKSEVKQSKGLVLYFYSTFLADRLIGTTAYFRWSDGAAPQYVLQNGELVTSGYFSDTSPLRTWFFQLFAGSNINKIFKINYPDSYSAKNFKVVCQSFNQLRNNVESDLHGAKFIVVLWRRMVPELRSLQSCLQKHGVSYAYLKKGPDNDFSIHKYERHLSAKGHAFYSEKLRHWLLARGLIPE